MTSIVEMAREAVNGRIAKTDAEAGSLIGLDEVTRFAELVRADERKIIYDIVLYAAFRDEADLLMPETEVDEDSADDFFKSSEFRYAMNNTVKATVFVITGAIRKRGGV